MTKIIFGIFAHPDDEAFGPSGALLKETLAGSQLHLITLTNGDAGTNPDNIENLGEVRLQEWQQASKLLGATSTHHFDYKDGHLNNLAMIEVGDRLVQLIADTLKSAPADATVEFMTLDLNGYTGHIDHIVAARAACFAFYHLKQSDTRLSRIRFACLPARDYPAENTNWIFMEKGRESSEIDEVVDARDLREELVAIAKTHHTQRADGEHFLKTNGDNLGLNYFIVRS